MHSSLGGSTLTRLGFCLAFSLALTAIAVAEDAPSRPEGALRIDTVGKVTVYSTKRDFPSKSVRADLKEALNEIWKYFSKQYGLEKEILRVGPKGGLFTEEKRDTAALVVFPTIEEYETWIKRAGTGGVTFHLGKYFNVVGIPMPEGKLTEEFLGVLWHELSHVFYFHYAFLGQPLWLNEGLAEYFHLKSKGRDSPAPRTRQEALDRLAGYRDGKTATPVWDLLLAAGDQFGRQQYDEAWVLAHLLMTQATDQLNEILSVLVDLDRSAWANADGVSKDIRRLAADLVTRLFGTPEKLQAAWDEHLANLLKDAEKPAKLKTPPKSPKFERVTPSIDVRLGGAAERPIDDKGNTMLMRRPRGSVVHRAPWEATDFEVWFGVGDQKGIRWSEPYVFVEKTTAKPGKKFEFIEAYMPHYSGSKKAATVVNWKVRDGGEYKTVEIWEYR